jgi:hypothetical protein
MMEASISYPKGHPGHAPDVELFGEGLTPPAEVVARIEAAPYAEFYRDAMGDDSHPYGWWCALIWNKA